MTVPTVVDRLIQQALQQKLSEIWDPTFSNASFGFRPGRSCHQAVKQAQAYIQAGHEIVVDMDVEKFFDRVNHDRLMSRLASRITDKRVLKLIRAYLTAGILDKGLVSSPDEGTPQGGPLSPLLSNIVLDELDKELERRGHKFVRYADDCNIYVKSERAGKRVLASVREYLATRLKLKINEAKSEAAPASKRKFLGFSFTAAKPAEICISLQALRRFKDRVKQLIGRSMGSMEGQIVLLSRYLQGWMGYFRLAQSEAVIVTLDRWIRRRLRALHLKKWRTPTTRYENFKKLGMPQKDCQFLIHTTKRYWYLSKTQALNFTLNLKYFRSLGLYFLMDGYKITAG